MMVLEKKFSSHLASENAFLFRKKKFEAFGYKIQGEKEKSYSLRVDL